MNSEIIIRQETSKDHSEVFELVKAAFENIEYTDHKEQFLVDRLRRSSSFIPELSLVAELNQQLAGHILLTKIKIVDGENAHDSLALAPVSVHPEYQGRGIGGMLIRAAHERAKDLGYTSIVLLGHEHYYPRFGYMQADTFGISLPFDVPKENCMAIELFPNSLNNVKGIVAYPKEFFE